MGKEVTEVHLVIGETGEYGDRTEWIAKSFFDIDDACEYVNKLYSIINKYEERKQIRKVYDKGYLEFEDCRLLCDELRSLDLLVRSDYTGVRYEIKTIYVE